MGESEIFVEVGEGGALLFLRQTINLHASTPNVTGWRPADQLLHGMWSVED